MFAFGMISSYFYCCREAETPSAIDDSDTTVTTHVLYHYYSNCSSIELQYLRSVPGTYKIA